MENQFTDAALGGWRAAPGQRAYITVCGGFEIHVTEFGDPEGRVVLGMHGLGGQGRTFTGLACHLTDRVRLICPDMIGRGKSQWSNRPESDYCFERYLVIAKDLIDQLGVDRFTWIGTSMGGALGIRAAAGQLGERLEALVLNDIGPELPPAVIDDIDRAIASEMSFASYEELAGHLATFLGQMAARPGDSKHWMESAVTGSRRLPDGRLALHHDPAVAAQFKHHRGDYDSWHQYRNVRCPVLILRGELSTVLTPEIAGRMVAENGKAGLKIIAERGHAPFLDTPDEARLIADFLPQ